MNYSEYQNLVSSEKLVLAKLDGTKRLMGWELHSGSIYKLEGITYKVLMSVIDSGTSYVSVGSIAAVTAGKYYFDNTNEILYVRTTGSDNPNGRFIVGTFRFFFANSPVTLPYDLSTGFEVYWEPLIKSTSEFGVEIDTVNQTSEAIEGSGSLTLMNDHDFWTSNFEKLTFSNCECSIYSFNRELAVTEAKLIYRGKVEKPSYTQATIAFQLKDAIAELKATPILPYIEDLAERHETTNALAFQRTIFGRVFGFRPTNLDAVNDGYPVTGTIAINTNTSTLTGTGTAFLSELSRDDRVIINGETFTVGSVASNTSAAITESFTGANITGVSIYLMPETSRRFTNRLWKIANHAICQPTTTTLSGSTVSRVYLTSTAGMFDGDYLYIGTLGSGELVTIDSVVNSQLVKLSTSLLNPPVSGVAVVRPAVQNVRINDLELLFYRDYTIDATNAEITLRNTAEANAAPIRQMSSNLTFTNGLRTVTGSGLDAIFRTGYMVSQVGQATFFEVMDVTETTLTLRTASTFTGTQPGLFQSIVLSDDDVLTCDVLGRTANGTSSGSLIRTGPKIIQSLLEDAGLVDIIDSASFDAASATASQDIALVIPEQYDDKKTKSYRDYINMVNRSILGNLIQTDSFMLSYFVIQPRKDTTVLRLSEADILDFSVSQNSQNMIKTAIVEYKYKEYDYLTLDRSNLTSQQTSNVATYILKTDKSKTFTSLLVEETDARILANRWSFILEHTAGTIEIKTKLQATTLEVGDVIDIEHRKLFVRFGGTDTRRLVLVQKVKKNGLSVQIEAVDLSNAFNRCANITVNSHPAYSGSSGDDKIIGGYVTDNYGMQSNDPDTFGINLIW